MFTRLSHKMSELTNAFKKQLKDIKGKLDNNPYNQLYLLGYNLGFMHGAVAGSIVATLVTTIMIRSFPSIVGR